MKQSMREILAEAALLKEQELRNGPKRRKNRTVELILDRRNRR